jgi:ubiquinone/menaquinone biosynthesis C-methylase UbiE
MYPLIYSLFVDRVMHGIRKRVPGFSGMRAGEAVLDVCCGTGAQALLYGQIGITSYGIDLEPRMIEFAEKRRSSLRLANTFFQRANATDLPFKDGFFDHASISMGLHDKEETSRDRVIMEMRRVVKKGGSLIIVDYRVPYPRNAYSHAVRIVEQIAGEEHFRCFRDFIEAGGLDSLLRRHSLREERVHHSGRMPIALLQVRNI